MPSSARAGYPRPRWRRSSRTIHDDSTRFRWHFHPCCGRRPDHGFRVLKAAVSGRLSRVPGPRRRERGYGVAGRLLDKVTIVTGAASGQGRAAARLFAAEGARLVLSDLDRAGLDQTAALLRASGQDALLHLGDLAEEATAHELVDLAIGRYGRLDVMYNNAGRVRFSPLHETSLEDWLFCLRNELTTVFLGCKYALRAMLPARSGAIVNAASA